MTITARYVPAREVSPGTLGLIESATPAEVPSVEVLTGVYAGVRLLRLAGRATQAFTDDERVLIAEDTTAA